MLVNFGSYDGEFPHIPCDVKSERWPKRENTWGKYKTPGGAGFTKENSHSEAEDVE